MDGSTSGGSQKLFWYEGPDRPEPGFEVYKHLATSEFCADDRAYLEGLWLRYSKLGIADPDFLEKFPQECPARIWEIRLACLFDNWGVKLKPSPRRGAGMDFGFDLANGRTCWVEATAPMPGTGPDKLTVPDGQVVSGREVARTTALRYLGAIAAKRDQFKRALAEGLVDQNDALLIAISGSQLRLADVERPGDPPLITQILFGQDDSGFLVELGNGRVTEGIPVARPSFRKKSGSEVQAGIFLSAEAEEISAVLFDPHNVKNRPEYRLGASAGRDIVVIHNAHARTPLVVGRFPDGREFYLAIHLADHRAALKPERPRLMTRVRRFLRRILARRRG